MNDDADRFYGIPGEEEGHATPVRTIYSVMSERETEWEWNKLQEALRLSHIRIFLAVIFLILSMIGVVHWAIGIPLFILLFYFGIKASPEAIATDGRDLQKENRQAATCVIYFGSLAFVIFAILKYISILR